MCWTRDYEGFIPDNYIQYMLKDLTKETELVELKNLKQKIAEEYKENDEEECYITKCASKFAENEEIYVFGFFFG